MFRRAFRFHSTDKAFSSPYKTHQSRFPKHFGKGFAGGLLVSCAITFYLHQSRLRRNAAVPATHVNQKAAGDIDALLRTVPINEAGVVLYRYTTCPFCSKVKAFLDFHKIPHVVEEVEPMFKEQIGWSLYQKVPQITFANNRNLLMVDSDSIVDGLLPYVAKLKRHVPVPPSPEVEEWREWTRSRLSRYLVLAVNKSLASAWDAYGYIDDVPNVKPWQRLFLKVAGTPVMYLVGKYKTKPSLLKIDTFDESADPEAVLRDKLALFTGTPKNGGVPTSSEASKSQLALFHGGSTPDLADVEVFGCLQSIRSTILYNSLLSDPRLGPWLKRMEVEVQDTSVRSLPDPHK